MVGVFAAAEGAQALFGSGGEDLQKTLVKLNGALALLNGLQAIQAEVAKKDTIASKALTIVKGQYAIATDASAKATLRLGAALKLLGIGLIIGGIAALVVYWKDIAKYIGITSDESERLNDVNKEANNLYGEQIAKLKILVNQVKEGELSFREKKEAVNDYNETFGETFGKVESYIDLERKLIEQGDEYIRYLGLKAQAEAAYQLAVEKSKEALLARNSNETNFTDYFKSLALYANGVVLDPSINATVRNNKEASELEKEADDLLVLQQNFNAEMEALAKALGLPFNAANKELEKEFNKLSDLLQNLIKKQKSLKTDLIENDRERDKTELTNQLEDEKQAYQDSIDALKVSEQAKRKLREEFNKIYNEDTGTAYEKLRKGIQEIDEKYNAELEKVQFKALNAIDSVLGASEQVERQAIQDKWDNIRAELEKQIEQTNDQFQKEGLKNILVEVDTAENKELQDFDIDTNLDQVDRQKEIADSILEIYQNNAKDVINNEKLKQLQLLVLEENYLQASIKAYQDGIKGVSDKTLFDELINTLQTSVDPDELQEAGKKLAETFGEETAAEILKTVAALKEVGNEISEISKVDIGSNISDAFKNMETSFQTVFKGIGSVFGANGEFMEALGSAAFSVYESLQEINNLEIEERKKKIDAIEESIDKVEEEAEREKQLYEDGYANNYDARQKDLEALKAQKAQEEEELKKAQKKKAAFAKAEFLQQTASQLGNMITSATSIFEWATASGGPYGVPVAVAAIAAMFGAFAIAKAKAFQAIGSGQNFRRGLKEGPLSLNGPTHEDHGFGLYNSKTGERVAEFENGEKVYVANKQQQRKYSDVLDAMINDSQGGMSLDHYLKQKYSVPNTGETTMQVVRHVNHVTVKAEKSKEEASLKNENIIEEISKLRQDFKEEFKGYKKERENTETSWETPNYFVVKKGNKTKKYPKK